MNLSKTVKFDEEVQAILDTRFAVDPLDGKWLGKIEGQLDRKLYAKVNKALEVMGGKWNRKLGGHLFDQDPTAGLEKIVDEGKAEVALDGFFRTPPELVELALSYAPLLPEMSVLEPSAGDGAIADTLCAYVSKGQICCVEKDEGRAKILTGKGYDVFNVDFMDWYPGSLRFDRVFMNPPFERGQDIDHVVRARTYVNNGGMLAAFMSEGAFFRDDRKARDFRDWLKVLGGNSHKLPSGSFKSSGTSVETRLIIING